MTRESVVYT